MVGRASKGPEEGCSWQAGGRTAIGGRCGWSSERAARADEGGGWAAADVGEALQGQVF